MYPEKISDPVKLEIAAKFHFRCVRCHGEYRDIHEIDTRGALGDSALREENRIPLCRRCHDWAHTVGTENSRLILLACRRKALDDGKKTKRRK